jgi:hypothetical protein
MTSFSDCSELALLGSRGRFMVGYFCPQDIEVKMPS